MVALPTSLPNAAPIPTIPRPICTAAADVGAGPPCPGAAAQPRARDTLADRAEDPPGEMERRSAGDGGELCVRAIRSSELNAARLCAPRDFTTLLLTSRNPTRHHKTNPIELCHMRTS
ncbi:unnamed protein product [Lampetra fluviatilis]